MKRKDFLLQRRELAEGKWEARSMGPGGHVRCLDLVMGALTGAQWVQNDRLRASFLA